MKRITEKQRGELLEVVRGVLKGAEWAPEEAWLVDGLSQADSRSGSEPLHFKRYCECSGGLREPATLTLFIKGDLTGTFNITAKIQHAVERWAKANLKWMDCGVCNGDLYVDVRLFRTNSIQDPTSEEVDGELLEV